MFETNVNIVATSASYGESGGLLSPSPTHDDSMTPLSVTEYVVH